MNRQTGQTGQTSSTTPSASLGPGQLPQPGEVICGKYRIESVIGAGGMGVVLGAVDISLGRPVAIKLLAPDKADREGSVARFDREARAAAAIQSEHVARVFEVGALPSGEPIIVMEQLRGADLAHVLVQRGPLSIPEACDLLLQVCEALGEAHARGIIHRDLKPQNLFLTQRPDGSPCVKVLDFGISKAMNESASNLTSTDMVMGTPLYMSPEQVRSLKNVDARADIWALGSILFELLTRTPIFEAPSASALCAMIAMDPPTPLRRRRPDAPFELEALILRCLHKDPSGRFQDVGSLAHALAPFASPEGRESALRVSRIVQATTGPLSPHGQPSSPPMVGYAMSPGGMLAAPVISTTGTGPTIGGPPIFQSRPPSMAPALGASNRPPEMHPTTQSTWQQTGATPKSSRVSGVVVAIFGLLTGLVLLFAVGGGVWYFVLSRETPAVTTVTADAGATVATAGPQSVPSAGPAMTTKATSTPTAKLPTPNKPVDGGAPSPSVTDGGSAPTPPPAPTPPDKDDTAELAKINQQQCAFQRQQYTRFGQDDASKKKGAAQAKNFMCRGLASTKCERQVCLEACTILEDKLCLQQVRYAIDHGPTPKY